MPQPVYILFGAAFTVFTALALGKLLLRGFRLRFYRTEETLLAYFAGSACLSALVFALAAAHLVYKGVFLGVGVAAIGAAVWKGVFRDSGEALPPMPRFWKLLFGVLFTVYLVVYFTNAMTPEHSPDGAAYHLGLVARYYREHGFRTLTTNMYANLSQGVEMLYLYAFAFGRHSAAALVHFSFLAALPLAMLSYARRFGFAAAGACAGLLVFLSPVFGMDGTTAYVDVAVAAILFAVFYFVQIWDGQRAEGLYIPIGLMAGFAYAAKYTAFLALPYALGFIAWKLVRERRPALRPLLVVTACALLLILPWMAKNWLWLGNPLSPFFNKVFPNPYVHVSLEEEWTRYLRSYAEIKSPWQIPMEVTVRGRVLCGLLGPVFLLAPLGLLALREKAGRRVLAVALLFGLAYPFNIGTRFLIPVVVFLALAMGLVLTRARAMAPLLVLFHALVSWPTHLKIYSDQYAWRLEKPLPWKPAFRVDPEDSFLTRSLPGYITARMIEAHVPAGERVFVLTQIAESYTSRDILVGYQAAFNHTIGDTLWAPIVDDFHPRRQVTFRAPPEPVTAIRVVQTARSGSEHWTVAEMHVLRNGQPVRRPASWKLRAKPNPWDVEMAFDGNLATRWRSWWTLFPGMFLEVDFGRSEILDGVRLDCALGQYDMRMRLEGRTPLGEWKTLDADPRQIVAEDPPGLRRRAVAAILGRRVQWVMLNDSDFGSEDLLKKTAEWGIKPVADRNGARLYRLY
ncbi:MAG: glycosyltransferase family 39 protein [Bryobacterales bacterium]|nr:glycosyltransferase family 39 protein [Bryobacterales bacterium]